MSVRFAFYSSLGLAALMGALAAVFIDIAIKLCAACAAVFIGYSILKTAGAKLESLAQRLRLRKVARKASTQPATFVGPSMDLRPTSKVVH